MKGNSIKEFNRGFGFIEILVVLVIILFLCYKVLNLYFKKAPFDKETLESISGEGVDATNYKTILDSAKEKVKNLNLRIESQSKELENIK